MREFMGRLSLSLSFMAVARILNAETTMTRHEAAKNSSSSTISITPDTLPADKDNPPQIYTGEDDLLTGLQLLLKPGGVLVFSPEPTESLGGLRVSTVKQGFEEVLGMGFEPTLFIRLRHWCLILWIMSPAH